MDESSRAAPPSRLLTEGLDRIGRLAPDEILDRFLDWVTDQGLEPYAAQEDAFLELMAGRHLILNTPTGSGKSLVALALHFKALCEGARSFYTSPIKALASEKFFALCEQLGPENVGMLTGDASINAAAPVICCTAEVLANMALRQGAELPIGSDSLHQPGWSATTLTEPIGPADPRVLFYNVRSLNDCFVEE